MFGASLDGPHNSLCFKVFLLLCSKAIERAASFRQRLTKWGLYSETLWQPVKPVNQRSSLRPFARRANSRLENILGESESSCMLPLQFPARTAAIEHIEMLQPQFIWSPLGSHEKPTSPEAPITWTGEPDASLSIPSA